GVCAIPALLATSHPGALGRGGRGDHIAPEPRVRRGDLLHVLLAVVAAQLVTDVPPMRRRRRAILEVARVAVPTPRILIHGRSPEGLPAAPTIPEYAHEAESSAVRSTRGPDRPGATPASLAHTYRGIRSARCNPPRRHRYNSALCRSHSLPSL